jgi:hypothetical protein
LVHRDHRVYRVLLVHKVYRVHRVLLVHRALLELKGLKDLKAYRVFKVKLVKLVWNGRGCGVPYQHIPLMTPLVIVGQHISVLIVILMIYPPI